MINDRDHSLIDADTTRPCFDFRIHNENLETIPLWPIYFVATHRNRMFLGNI